MVLDQSFSVKNFRKIFDIENRKGNYLEEKFFPSILLISQELKRKRHEYKALKTNKNDYSEQEYFKLREDLGEEIKAIKERRENQIIADLNNVSQEALAQNFVIKINEVDIGTNKRAFVHEDTAAAFFAMKQIQFNIRRLYKVKQSNRHEIICQLREIVDDEFPKTIIRTDVKSFYESIPRSRLLEKLNRDTLLSVSTKKIIRKILFEYGKITGDENGLPRGLGISAYLSELYMRDFDKVISRYAGVIYYARYVDDIIVIFCSPPNTNSIRACRELIGQFNGLGLTRNREKSKLVHSPNYAPFNFEYLGYRFNYNNGGRVVLGMTESKIDEFQNQLIHERRNVISEEITNLTREINVIDRQYSEKLKILDQQGNLKSLKQTYAAFKEKADEASQLKAFISRFEDLETQKQEARTRKEADLLQFQSDIQACKETLASFEHSILDIHEYIQGNKKASFEIKPTSKKQVVEIVMRIDDDGSHSVEREKVFIYDIALLLNEHTASRHPGVLVHDNIFDVDQDTLIRSIKFLFEKAEFAQQQQYILTLNSDRLESDIRALIMPAVRAEYTKQKRFLKAHYQEERK